EIMSQVTEQSVRFQTALASIKLIQASAVLDLTEDDFDFLTSNKVWIATDRSRARRCVEACVYGTLDFVGYPRFPAPVEFIAAVIAYYVHPVNIQTACLIMEGAEFTENIINGVERPVKAAELFAFTLRVRDRKSGSAGMPRPISYAVFCLKKKKETYMSQDSYTIIIIRHTFLITLFFSFTSTPTTDIYTLSLHDALPILLIMFIPSTFKRPVSSWKALNLRKTLLMASSVRLKPLNCSRLPCVYAQETLTFLLTQKKTCVKNYVQKE